MRIGKILLAVSIFAVFASSALASNLFYRVNSDLKRIGLDEIKNMSSAGFEAGNYRLDPDFKLGYGDTVTVNLWGKIEASHKLVINRDGEVLIPLVGKIGLMGLSLDEARAAIKKEIDSKYANVELGLNLADVRDIRISVLGNVQNPGSYAVSPFCRIIEAIARAGGPTDYGSICDIKLLRDGKEAVSFDAYDFLFKADNTKNARLKQGDVIYISGVKNLVAIRGEVARPGIYEADDKTKLSAILETAGGMPATELKRKIFVLRVNAKNNAMEILKEIKFEQPQGIKPEDDILLKYGDSIVVTTESDFVPYREDLFSIVHVSGEVKMPGDYLIKKGETLSSLLKKIVGFNDNAFIQGAVFTRRSISDKQKSIMDELIMAQQKSVADEEQYLADAILTPEEKKLRQRAVEDRRKVLNIMSSRRPEGRIMIDMEGVLNGKSDVLLVKDDEIYIPPIPDWVLVSGATYNPQAVSYADGKPLEYYLNITGGPAKFADKDDIYIIKADGRTESRSTGYTKTMRGDIIVVPEKSSR